MHNLWKSGTNYNDVGNLSFDTDFLAVGPEIAEQLKTSPGSNNGQLRLKMTDLAVLQTESGTGKN